jgi:uncharacterized protein (DUF305 family)
MWQHSRVLSLSATVVFLLFTMPAVAQQQPSSQMPAGDKDYLPAMNKMHKDMMAAVDPDPTKTWVKMMIPHHQGAIDMSKAVLKQTKDPKIRAMAEKVVKEQSKEIKELQDWLKKNGG